MVVADKRRNFIVSTASHFFGLTVQEAVNDVPALVKFLESDEHRTLCALPVRHGDDEPRLKLVNELPNNKNALVFFKVSCCYLLNLIIL